MSQVSPEYKELELSTMDNVDVDPERGETSPNKPNVHVEVQSIDPVSNMVVAVEEGKVPMKVWITLLISSVGVFLASVSTSALIIAFPVILVDLEMTLDTLIWILLVIQLVICAVAGSAGKLGDIFGQAALYKFGYFVFVAASLGGGFSHKGNQGFDMLAARVIIGFGAAFLFTNSSAILTNAFAPYNLVGLSQGIFSLSSSMGMVLGPVIGGAFSQTNWRWIFFFNAPVGGPMVLLALFVVKERADRKQKSLQEFVHTFDWIGSFFYPLSIVLFMIAMVQVVSPTRPLDQAGPVAALLVCGGFAFAVCVVDQFYAKDPMFPPDMFLKSRVFSLTVVGATMMAFVRGSITYIMIFFLQGPYGMNPLKAGIELVPYGIGVMAAGFGAGILADKIGVRVMTVVGPCITILALGVMTTFKAHTSSSTIQGVLFLAGFGIGCFNSPNAMANMLSVLPQQRGAASAVSMCTMMFMMMIGICITFSLVLNSMSSADLFNLFINGGGGLSTDTIDSCIAALQINMYIVMAACAVAVVTSSFNDFQPPVKVVAGTSATTADKNTTGVSEEEKQVQLSAKIDAGDVEDRNSDAYTASVHVHSTKDSVRE